jgi:hypothetical protein
LLKFIHLKGIEEDVVDRFESEWGEFLGSPDQEITGNEEILRLIP